MAFKLPDLPYDKDALEPHVSAKTLEYHYGKHHQGYVDKLNDAIADTNYAELDLREIVRRSKGNGDTNVFNNAAQAWNHQFLWDSMSPDGGGEPEGRLAELIDDAFGGVDGFKEAFKSAATDQFGSGWAWLAMNGDSLVVTNTANADNPLTTDRKALLTLDVWEHAYYLDYQNERDDYVDKYLEHLINWSFASANLTEE